MEVGQDKVILMVITNTINFLEMWLISLRREFDLKVDWIKNLIQRGEKRSVVAKKNIIGSFLIKAINMLISFVLVPITINYINPSQYGVWLTLTSMVAWVALFDVGLTQGLRNKFAEAKATGNKQLARTFVSTTYYYVAIIFLVAGLLMFIGSKFIDWYSFINIPKEGNEEIVGLIAIIISYFCLQFIFQIVKTVITSDQKPALASLIDLIGQVLVLVAVFLLTKFTQGSLIYLGLAMGCIPVLILIIANIYFFSHDYYDYRPSLAFVDKKHSKELMSMGGKFFVLQLAAMIQYSTSLFLIAHFFNPESVTSYNIAFRYFVALQTIFMIFISPLWSSTTEAYFMKEFDWILRVIKKYLLLIIPFLILGLLMLLFSDVFYRFWLGASYFKIDFTISFFCFLSVIISMFSSVFVNVVNGMGTLKIQFVSSIVTSILFLVLSFLFIKMFNFGVWSIIFASILSNVYGYFIAPIQVYKVLIEKSKNPIWY